MTFTFDARELWASQGTPYIEPDIVTPVAIATAYVTTMTFAALWRMHSELAADATIVNE